MSFTRLWKAVVVLDTALEEELLHKFVQLGASGYTTMECNGAGRKAVYQEPFSGHSQLRVEIVGTRTVCEAIVRHTVCLVELPVTRPNRQAGSANAAVQEAHNGPT